MFLETTAEGKIYKEPADYHFVDPEGLGRYAFLIRPARGDLIPAQRMEQSQLLSGRYRPITLEGRNFFASRSFYAFFRHLEEKGIESTDRGIIVIAMNKLREIMREVPEVLDNARLTSDGKSLYLIKNKMTNIRD